MARMLTWNPLHLLGLTIASVSVQYVTFKYAFPHFIRRNFSLHQKQHSPEDFIKNGEIVGGPVALQELLTIGFHLNPDLLKTMGQQVFSAVLLAQSLSRGRTPIIPAACCLLSSMTSAYLVWSPAIRLLSLSALTSPSDDYAYRRFLLIREKSERRYQHLNFPMSSGAILLTLAAIPGCLPGSTAAMTAIAYLVFLVL